MNRGVDGNRPTVHTEEKPPTAWDSQIPRALSSLPDCLPSSLPWAPLSGSNRPVPAQPVCSTQGSDARYKFPMVSTQNTLPNLLSQQTLTSAHHPRALPQVSPLPLAPPKVD